MKTKEYHLSNESLWYQIKEDFEETGGAYKLLCKEDGKVRPIGRLLGSDLNGVLYIGKADSYLDRVIGLKKTLDPKYKSAPHICGRRYNLNDRIKQAFPYPNLYIQLIGSDNPVGLEKQLLTDYFDKFGEVPPLNAV